MSVYPSLIDLAAPSTPSTHFFCPKYLIGLTSWKKENGEMEKQKVMAKMRCWSVKVLPAFALQLQLLRWFIRGQRSPWSSFLCFPTFTFLLFYTFSLSRSFALLLFHSFTLGWHTLVIIFFNSWFSHLVYLNWEFFEIQKLWQKKFEFCPPGLTKCVP